MEELIRLKIAELEETYPQQGLENKLINDILTQENDIQYEESEMCRPFDSEVSFVGLLFLHDFPSPTHTFSSLLPTAQFTPVASISSQMFLGY
jgi:hypothetical protein